MKIAALPPDEKQRLKALKNLHILDTGSEQEFEDVVLLASAICQTPISLVTLVDGSRQWFKARIGLDVTETSRDVAFCAHALHQNDLMIVPNALEDNRFYDNPLVTEDPNIRFYAGMPLVTEGGYKLGTLCVIDRIPRDLSEEQKFALRILGKQVINSLELRSKNARLADMNNMQNKFLSIISHDVKNPLYSLNSLLDMFQQGDIPADQLTELTIESQKQISQTLTLLDDLIKWSAGTLNSDDVKFEDVDLHELAGEMLAGLVQAAERKNNILVNLVQKPMLIKADVNMIRFVLRNLLTNAIKFTSGGRITVSATSTATGWEIKVSDTGVGMPKEKIAALFNWQQRYTTTGTNNERGTGLGLLLCKDFAGRHNGTIEITSEAGKGSTFSFIINTV